jgi:hypothetical protein
MGVVTVTEEFLRHLADHAGSNLGRDGIHTRIDALDGAVGRAELQRRADAEAAKAAAAAAPPAPPDPRDAELAELRAQLAAAKAPTAADTPAPKGNGNGK